MKVCPVCNASDHVHRSHGKGFWEKRLLPLIRLRPFRCSKCRSRFHRFYRPSSNGNGAQMVSSRLPGFLDPPDPEEFEGLCQRLQKREEELNQAGQNDRHRGTAWWSADPITNRGANENVTPN